MRSLALVAVMGSVAAAAPRTIHYTDNAMGTIVNVYVWSDDEKAVSDAAKAVFDEMKRLDLEMTTWKPDSEVSKINAAAGLAPVQVSEETFAVIDRAIDVSKRSGGVFDITVGSFKGLWKFDEDMDGSLPDPAEVKKRLELVGWRHVVLDRKKHTVFIDKKGVSMTLGGIAKGYAVDKCVALLAARGFKNFMMQAGGDMYIAGSKDGVPWRVGIRDPRGQKDSQFAMAPIQDHSFSTSGDYERGFVRESDHKRFHHILDPRTGFPATASRSVTIRAKDAFTADAWSKVMFIYGPVEGKKIIDREKLGDFEVVWVDDKNQVVVTDGIKKDLVLLRQPTDGP